MSTDFGVGDSTMANHPGGQIVYGAIRQGCESPMGRVSPLDWRAKRSVGETSEKHTSHGVFVGLNFDARVTITINSRVVVLRFESRFW